MQFFGCTGCRTGSASDQLLDCLRQKGVKLSLCWRSKLWEHCCDFLNTFRWDRKTRKTKRVCLCEHVCVLAYLCEHSHLGMTAFGNTWTDHQQTEWWAPAARRQNNSWWDGTWSGLQAALNKWVLSLDVNTGTLSQNTKEWPARSSQNFELKLQLLGFMFTYCPVM